MIESVILSDWFTSETRDCLLYRKMSLILRSGTACEKEQAVPNAYVWPKRPATAMRPVFPMSGGIHALFVQSSRHHLHGAVRADICQL